MPGLFRINSNTAATFAQRQLSATNETLSKSRERLASGKRINSAADDAAGLAVSNRLEYQFKGQERCQKNAQDAISMLQTAEGGYQAVNSKLQRLRELAIQAANDSLTTRDRQALEEERQQLTEEIDRLHETVEFNGKKLLQGFGEGKNIWNRIKQSVLTAQAGGNPEDVKVTISFTPNGTSTDEGPGNNPQDYFDGAGAGQVTEAEFQQEVISAFEEWSRVCKELWGFELDVTNLGLEDNTSPPSEYGQDSYQLDQNGDGTVEPGEPGDFRVSMPSIDGQYSIISQGSSPGGILGTEGKFGGDMYFDHDDDWRRDGVTSGGDPGSLSVKNLAVTLIGQGLGLETNSNSDSVMCSTASLQSFSTEHGGSIPEIDQQALKQLYEEEPLKFHVGPNRDETIQVYLEEINSYSLKINNSRFTSRENAERTIETYTEAINHMNETRARVGSKINRLESTISSLGIRKENTQASKSQIKDAEISKVATKNSRSQILMKAGQSVLAQANTTPKLALQLL